MSALEEFDSAHSLIDTIARALIARKDLHKDVALGNVMVSDVRKFVQPLERLVGTSWGTPNTIERTR